MCVFLLLSENWMDGKTMFISAQSSSSTASHGISSTSSSYQTSSVVVNNLSPMTAYYFRIRAENDLGKSDYSQEISVTTTIEGEAFLSDDYCSEYWPFNPLISNRLAPQFVPSNVTAVPLDSKSVRVTWNVPHSALKDVLFIEGFYIGYKVYSSSDSFSYKTMHVSSHADNLGMLSFESSHASSSSDKRRTTSNSMSSNHLSIISSPSSLNNSSHFSRSGKKFEYTIDLLRKSTKYSIVIQGFNSRGAGPSSPEVTVQTFANGKWDTPWHTLPLFTLHFISCWHSYSFSKSLRTCCLNLSFLFWFSLLSPFPWKSLFSTVWLTYVWR